jgi:hypothetical protein
MIGEIKTRAFGRNNTVQEFGQGGVEWVIFILIN